MLRVAITQPNFLPWLGYFEMLDAVDLWISLDNVQVSRHSFHTRNRIVMTNGRLRWLSVSLEHAPEATNFCDAFLCPTDWSKQLLRRIRIDYQTARYFDQYWPFWKALLPPRANERVLSIYNRRLIEEMCSLLKIRVNVIDASQLIGKLDGTPQQKVLQLCQAVRATDYLAQAGGIEAGLYDSRGFAEHGIRMWKQTYRHPMYRQTREAFVSHLSILDLVMNEGIRALEVLRQGSSWLELGPGSNA